MGGALLKSKTSDEQQYMRVAIDAMEQLALLLRVPFLNVRKSIIETILSFWEQRPNVPIRRVGGGGSGRGGAGMYRTCSKEFHEAVIEHSKVVSTLVQAMPLLQPDEHILALVVLEQLTRNSAANVASIVSCRGAQLIALLLPGMNLFSRTYLFQKPFRSPQITCAHAHRHPVALCPACTRQDKMH